MVIQSANSKQNGFTLIELSIVLVIIGLIVGGVLVGQSLISAAGVRATITQVEKFNTAANTFYSKYGFLPGDINANAATQFGLAARGTYVGQGDGDGLIEGFENPGTKGGLSVNGEPLMFWSDLTYANGQNLNLVEGNFNTATATTTTPSSTGSAIDKYLPAAKLGGGNYFSVWSGGPKVACCPETNHNGRNYFALSSVQTLGYTSYFTQASPGLTVSQAAAIDSKIDDGIPQYGNVTANYPSCLTNCNTPTWAGAGSTFGAPYTTATNGSATSCFDNSGNGGTAQQYSTEISGGSNVTCALSFKMQAGD